MSKQCDKKSEGSWAEGLASFCSESVDAVVLDECVAGAEVSKGSQDVAFSNTDVPELSGHLGSSFLALPDLGDEQNEAGIGVETGLYSMYLLEFFPPKM